MKAIEFSNVTCGYGPKTVLDAISFDVPSGEVIGLVGRNGAGKTTLIRSAMAMIKPHSGAIQILGQDPFVQPELVKERIGYVSEDQILPPFLKTHDVMELHKSLYPKTWDDHLARSLAGTFNLPQNQKISKLSKGQARQVALVCAVAHRPELLILDEPAGGLDPSARREFLETSIAFLNECGSTILFSSHYMTDVERMSNRLLMLHSGRILLDRDMDELKEEFTLTVIPEVEGIDSGLLLDHPSCLSVRKRDDRFHAVFQLTTSAAQHVLEKEIGITGCPTKAMNLEELFVEVTGSQK